MVITLSVLNGFSKMLSLLEGEVNFQQNPYNTSHQALNPRKLMVVRSTAASPLTSVTSKTSSTGGHTPRLTSSDGPLAGRATVAGDNGRVSSGVAPSTSKSGSGINSDQSTLLALKLAVAERRPSNDTIPTNTLKVDTRHDF